MVVKLNQKTAADSPEMKIISIIFATYTVGFKIYGPVAYTPIEVSPLYDVFCREWLFGISPGQFEISPGSRYNQARSR